MNHSLSPEKGLVFRIVHVKNVPWILDHGLHCRASGCVDADYIDIGSADMIAKRTSRSVPVAPGGDLSDYVPFYFTPYSIMLLNIITGYNVPQQPRQDIVILVSSLHRFVELEVPFVFTDRHAYPVSANYFNDMKDLAKIDWPLLRSKDFKNDPNDPAKKERYQAEALAHRHVPVDALLGTVCYNEEVRNWLRVECTTRALNIRLEVRPNWYF